MNTWIVRIYRYAKDDRGKLVGLVEEVGVKGRRGFANYDELWEILNNDRQNNVSRTKKANDRTRRRV